MPSDAGPTAKERLAWLAIQDNAALAQNFVAGMTPEAFAADRRTFYAVTRCLEIISESVRDHVLVWHSFRSMRRTEARRRNASAFRLRHSQSLARRRQRLSQAMVRSTIHRFGRTVKPLAQSKRLTISTSMCLSILPRVP